MIRIAQIINTRGLKGECKLKLFTDQPELRFAPGTTVYLDKKEPLKVSRYSSYKGFGYVYFDSITSIEQAEKMKTHTLYIPKEELNELEDGEYYYHQLAGCEVFNQRGERTGKVTELIETGANLVLRVQNGDSSYLLPFVEAFVTDVDVDNGRIEIREMEGLR